ncbi:hypothetical protein IWX49DRAFT_302446 [Phyllosticta citricarpa]
MSMFPSKCFCHQSSFPSIGFFSLATSLCLPFDCLGPELPRSSSHWRGRIPTRLLDKCRRPSVSGANTKETPPPHHQPEAHSLQAPASSERLNGKKQQQQQQKSRQPPVVLKERHSDAPRMSKPSGAGRIELQKEVNQKNEGRNLGSVVRLNRTGTTLDLSQKAKSGGEERRRRREVVGDAFI